VERSRKAITITGEGFRYVIDPYTGLPEGVQYNVWRAPTDNDAAVRQGWQRFGMDKLIPRVYSLAVQQADSAVTVTSQVSLAWLVHAPLMRLTTTVNVYPNGALTIALDGSVADKRPSLPRFGLRMLLPAAFDTADYLGYGPGDSYVDKHQSTWFGAFTEAIDAAREDHIKPQESGSHMGCTQVILRSGNAALRCTAGSLFGFNFSRYTQEELSAKRHNWELVPCDHAVLCLDAKMAGIGSNSCGPALDPAYQVSDKEWHVLFRLEPIKMKEV
jgi:beta-galactosidase